MRKLNYLWIYSTGSCKKQKGENFFLLLLYQYVFRCESEKKITNLNKDQHKFGEHKLYHYCNPHEPK